MGGWNVHRPHEDVEAHPLPHGEALERQILRVLERQVGKVEDRAQPEHILSVEPRGMIS
jgi:hypothetical protein